MRPLLILIFVCFYCGKLCGQSFYVTDRNSKLHEITITNNVITDDRPINGCYTVAQSLAFQRNVLYYTNGNQLFKTDIAGNTSTNCPPSYGTFRDITGLTIDKKGVLYLVSANKLLQTFDPSTNGALVSKGLLPDKPSADMIFYKDQLYVSASSGIFKVNMANPDQSQLVIPTTDDILGLTVVSASSTVNKVYALKVVGNNTSIIELDLDNNTIGKTIGTLPYYVFDAASNVEDGSYINLEVDAIKTAPDCPFTGRGTVQVINNNANSNYRYTLAGITNNTGVFTNIAPGPYQVTISNGPESKQTPFNVEPFQLAKPILDKKSRDPKCLEKGNITISTKTDAEKYSIFFEGKSYPMNQSFDLNAGKYHFDIRNANDCVVDVVDETLTQQICPIVLDSLVIKQDCSDPKKGSVTAYTSPGTDKYHFAIKDITPNTTGSFTGLAAQSYTIKITSDGGGSTEVPFVIEDLSKRDPQVSYIKNDATCRVFASVKFNIATANSTGYTVTYASASYPIDHVFQLPDTGRYSFRILKPGGCLLKDTTVQIGKQQCQTVFFPNTFTPNNDGVNDIFRPVAGTTADNLKLKVFNRLGAIIYTSEQTKTGWDGTYQGKPVPAGVYYWMASYINNEGINTSQNGSITLLR